MTYFVVENQDGLDVEFEGELLIDEYHHDVGFIKVYQTNTGKFILSQNRSRRPGIVLIRRVSILNSIDEVGVELGSSSGAKKIKQKLGIKTRLRI